jgi:hypothetical protein
VPVGAAISGDLDPANDAATRVRRGSEMVTCRRRVGLGRGDVIVAVGAVVSVEADATTRPPTSAYGCTPMSAKRLTIACCMFRSAGRPLGLSPSMPQAHWTVPAPKTNAEPAL